MTEDNFTSDSHRAIASMVLRRRSITTYRGETADTIDIIATPKALMLLKKLIDDAILGEYLSDRMTASTVYDPDQRKQQVLRVRCVQGNDDIRAIAADF